MQQISKRIAGFLASSSQEARRWENLRVMASLSTDSAVKTASRKSARSSNPRSRVSKVLPEVGEPEKVGGDGDAQLEVSVEPAKDAGLTPVEGDLVKPETVAKELPKPGQIPWQTKAANSVNLIGHLGAPLQFDVGPDGDHKAVSILVNDKTTDLPRFWIPIVFRGELAQIAACNLREKDHVYVTGQLTRQPEAHDKEAECKIMVMVNSISYVLELSREKENQRSNEPQPSSSDRSSLSSSSSPSTYAKDDSSALLWDDLFKNPHKWWDNRSKENKKYGGFKHKDTGKILEINESTPGWVFMKMDSLISDRSNADQKKRSEYSKTEAQWADLLENREQWQDNREGKRTGKLNPKFPDFRQMATNTSLWLDSAPEWALLKLETVQVGRNGARRPSEGKNYSVSNKKDEQWKDLVENPMKWWDNRLSKPKPNLPDFKHKETGEGLWLSSLTPSWVHARLPAPMK